MSDSAADQLRRILDFVPRVADGRDHTVAELSALTGVDLGTLFGDLYSLTQRFDVPGGFVEGVTVLIESDTVSVTANHFHRPMRLTMPELCALELGLSVLRAERAPADHGPIDRALERLRGAITRLPSNDASEGIRHAEPAAASTVVHLEAVRAALRERHTLRLTYRRAHESESHARTVDPYALVYTAGMWYLVAHCDESDGVRIYRLDRIVDVAPTGARYGIPETFRLEAVLTDGKPLTGEPHEMMRVRYSPRIARWIAEREGRATAADGSLILEHPLYDREWGVRHVLQYGADAEILAPETMRVALADRLRRMREGARA